ncbi:MAG: DUF167 domain-containing protein [Actinomycetia bacterium]|nr:DUF167 domain-containing protein [Actinomycetes bacterium]
MWGLRHTGSVRVSIWVRPGSRSPGVGGARDGALVVRVRERAVDGKATEAALAALDQALGLPRGTARLVAGATSRRKLVELPDSAADPVAALLAFE